MSTFLLVKIYSYVIYVYEEKNARKYTIWAVGLFEGKIFFLILYTTVLLNVFISYIKKTFSAGLKFREKNFK